MQTIFITGANRGIGLGLTKRFLQAGQKVIAACRNPDGARDLWELETDYKGRLILLGLDVANSKDVESLPRQIPNDTVIDVLINCAGVLMDGTKGLRELSMQDVEKTFQVNVYGPMRVTRALIPYLEKSAHPEIVNITSQMGSIADNGFGTHYGYRMSKTALNMFTKNLAIEFPKWTSIAVHPGWVQTEMGGPNAKVSVNDSVDGIYRIITHAKPAYNGAFLSYQGETLPW